MRTLFLTSSCIAMAVPSFSQTALLREDDPSPSGTPGQTVSAISITGVNQTNGFTVTFTENGGAGFIGGIWGNLSGGPGALLRQETVVGSLTQTGFESFHGINATQIAYSATSSNASGVTGLDTVFIDDTLVRVEDAMRAGATDFWTFGSRPGITTGGVPYFAAGVADTAGGTTQRRGLFMGATPVPLYITGDTVPNTPFPLSTGAVDFDFRFSADGSHNLTPVFLAQPLASDGVMALDGAGLMLGGSLVRQGDALPVSVGGIAGETWDFFDYVGITNAGDYMFTGDTGGSNNSATDEYILRNGAIWHREGETIDGQVITGAIEGAFLNEANQLLYIWDIEVGGNSLEALFREETLLLQEGDAVDWDGDGVIDPAITIESFTGTNTLSLGMDGTAYFTADVDVNGSTLEGYFSIGGSGLITANYCMAAANSTGQTGVMSAAGSSFVQDNNLTVTASNLPLNQFGIFVFGATQGFVAGTNGTSNGNLCLGGSIGRFTLPSQILGTGSTGSFSLGIDITALPLGNGTVAVMSGDTWNFQGWHRDSVGLGSNFTDGIAVSFN